MKITRQAFSTVILSTVTSVRILFLAGSFYFALFQVFPSSCLASEENRASQERSYNKSELIWDFTNVSQDDTLWLENTKTPWISIKAQSQITDQKTTNSWWHNYVTFPQGLPERGVINKWNKGITIGIGWPQSNEKIDEETTQLVEKHIKEVIPTLSEATGLEISYQPQAAPQEQTENYAKIRIVPITETNLRNRFKTLYFHPNFLTENYFLKLQTAFLSAVPFTPYLKSSVDGYFIPDNKNNIQFAVCNILVSPRNNYLGSLVSECLIRALGLPNASKLNDTALVGNWNQKNDISSLTVWHDGDAAFWPTSSKQSKERKDFYSFSSDPYSASKENAQRYWTTYDLMMLKMLYCSSLKAGSSRQEAIQILLHNDACLEKE